MRNFYKNFEGICTHTNQFRVVFVVIGRQIPVIPVKNRSEQAYGHKMMSYEALCTPITLKSR